MVLVEAPLDAVDDGHCNCEGILKPTSHSKKKVLYVVRFLINYKYTYIRTYTIGHYNSSVKITT